MEEKWYGPQPINCQICNTTLKDKEFFVDGRIAGRWGIVCPSCFKWYGLHLGTG